MAIIQNKKGGAAVVLATANATITLANLAVSNTENVQSFSVTKVFWSTSGVITLSRGDANTVLNLQGTDHWPLDMYNIALYTGNTANLTITLPDANSSVVIEIKKVSDYPSSTLGPNL